jgi:hypothetical protein|tara:strand:- start:60 stop:308 length:249 start_codon:yes stop_codon:yes gene_type:complete
MRDIRIYIWSLVMDLEDWLYPWKTKNPPQWAVERYNLDSGLSRDIDSNQFYFDWLKQQEQKIQMIEKNIIGIHKKLDSMEIK